MINENIKTNEFQPVYSPEAKAQALGGLSVGHEIVADASEFDPSSKYILLDKDHLSLIEKDVRYSSEQPPYGSALIGMYRYQEKLKARNTDDSNDDWYSTEVNSEEKEMARDIKREERKVKDGLARIISRHPDVAEMVEAYPLPVLLRKALTEDGTKTVADGIINAESDTLKEFVDWNKEFFTEEILQRQPELDAAKRDFAKRLEQAVSQGLPVDLHTAQARLERLQLKFVDPLTLYGEDAGGKYVMLSESALIALDPSKTQDKIKKTAFHEMTHGVSGRKHFQHKAEISNGRSISVATRMGLQVSSPDNVKDWNPDPITETQAKLSGWTNEAITEHLAQILLHDSGEFDFVKAPREAYCQPQFTGGSYPNERVLTVLLAKTPGVKMHDFLQAYFEEAPDLTTKSKSAELIAQLTDEYGEDAFATTEKSPSAEMIQVLKARIL